MTAPDGDYIASFDEGYTLYAYDGSLSGIYDRHKSYAAMGLALGPDGRVYIADGTIIYRLEEDGTATRVVGKPQQPALGGRTSVASQVRRTNVLRDSVAALEAHIVPGAMAFDEEGRLYFVDYINGEGARIARLEADGRVTTFAGTGEFGYEGDGGSAREARFRFRARSFRAGSLVFDTEDNLLVADYGNGRIRRIDSQGLISTLVDVAEVDRNGEVFQRNGEIFWPNLLAIDTGGLLYFSVNSQVFRRHGDGTIERVAGSGERGFGGDGGLAIQAQLDSPSGMALDGQGGLYIADLLNHRIRYIKPDGLIETIAGNGKRDLDIPPCVAAEKPLQRSGNRCLAALGDGGLATEATIWYPEQLLLTGEGDLLVGMESALQGGFWGGGVFSQLRRICRVGKSVPTAVEESVSADLSDAGFPSLHIYPNPFNPEVTIAFRLEQPARVSAVLYDVLGQRVRTLAESAQRPAGQYQFIWDGRNSAGRSLSSGTYFFKLSIDDVAETSKLTLLR